MNFPGHYKDSSPTLSIGSKQKYQRLGQFSSELKLNMKSSSLSQILHSSRSYEPSPDTVKIQEAYQYLKLRNIGCTRNEAISLASKFKLNRENYLSDLLPKHKEKWKKSMSEEKFKAYSSAEDTINIDDLTKICERKQVELKEKKKPKINLRIINRKNLQDEINEKCLQGINCESKEIGGLTRVSTLNDIILPKISKEIYKSKSESMTSIGSLSLRKNSPDFQRSVEDEYLALMEKKKVLKEKIKAHKTLTEKQKKAKKPGLAKLEKNPDKKIFKSKSSKLT